MIYVEVGGTCVSLIVALARVLAIWIKERAFTDRLRSMLKDSTPEQRPELAIALGKAQKHLDGKRSPASDGTSALKTAPEA
ncbi:hypothetical protein KGA66_17070 [Actinocrinis puniceicyclus]|uniref:Uncharacterized protein n=1 Tax=Actinocrinis puniceicyclus TaxID=977794 RepID=A0A8J7WNY0_9ACTN|nr:hypothetical protein [Actinocrinis puniceicyclus]MBS2964773.1 hypothetical protein [Actinocrinis puniceicyclus]